MKKKNTEFPLKVGSLYRNDTVNEKYGEGYGYPFFGELKDKNDTARDWPGREYIEPGNLFVFLEATRRVDYETLFTIKALSVKSGRIGYFFEHEDNLNGMKEMTQDE